MNFLHVSLLAGLAAIAIPIALHFSGRRQPKTIEFPALRFVQATQIAASKGWTVKRWLLLILRCLLIALAVVALASPRVHGAEFGNWLLIGLIAALGMLAALAAVAASVDQRPAAVRYATLAAAAMLLTTAVLWGGWVAARGPSLPLQTASGPVAAAIVIDTSPTMDYRFANETRLEKAQEHARWIVDRLDEQSRIAIVTDSYGDRLQLGHAAAETQIDRLKVQGRPSDLVARIRKAVELVESSDLERREVYVLSDLGINAWANSDELLPKLIADSQPLLLQIVDVGSESVRNVGIDQVHASRQVAAAGQTVSVDVAVRAAGDVGEPVAIELLAEEQDPRLPMIRDGELVTPPQRVLERRLVEVPAGGRSDTAFQIRDLPVGTNHFSIRVPGTDPLAIDNAWPLTIEGARGGKIVLVEFPGADRDAAGLDVFSLMLDPTQTTIQRQSAADLAGDLVEDAAVYALYDPPADLPAEIATRLAGFVERGGGLLVVLGRSAKAGTAGGLASLLPGEIRRVTRAAADPVAIEPVDVGHGVWREFATQLDQFPWGRYPVFRHWDLEDLEPTASVVARYTVSGLPAIVESVRGQGRILVFTTPLPDLQSERRPVWNSLSAGVESWVGFAMVLAAGQHLQDLASTPRNFMAGETAFLQWPIRGERLRYELFHPEGSEETISIADGTLLYGFTQQIGHYRLRGIEADSIRSGNLGFSVHLAPGSTDLTRIEQRQLDERLGEGNYLLSRDRETLQQSIGEGRYGRDLSPFLLLFVVAVYFAEQSMSHHYYSPVRTGTRPR